MQAAFEDYYGIPILVSYGATEFAGPVAMMTEALHATFGRAKLGTVGRALPGAKLRVVEPLSGVALPHGEEGLLEVVSPRIGPDWIRTADLAVIDADHFLFLRGRADGAIMRGGFKVLPETIERALALHPAVAEAGVVGVPDAHSVRSPVRRWCCARGSKHHRLPNSKPICAATCWPRTSRCSGGSWPNCRARRRSKWTASRWKACLQPIERVSALSFRSRHGAAHKK